METPYHALAVGRMQVRRSDKRRPGRAIAAIAALVLGALLTLSACQPRPAPDAGSRPNIVLIVADDLGYGDLSSYGGAIPTPAIDALAAAGIRFTDFHANGPLCTPTRASLLTGRYAQRAGLNDALSASATIGLEPGEITIADVLKGAGYRTGLVGKWHLGHLPRFAPGQHGFDAFYGFRKGEIDYVNHLDSLGNPDWWRNTTPVHDETYSTTLITREAARFIRHNARRPFFLYVAYQAPHVPYQAPDDGPIRVPGQRKVAMEGDPARYPAMVAALDDGIGTIMRTLQDNGLEEDTLVLFLSDNGAFGAGSNRPLRGVKGEVYEGGHRVPAIAFWPGHIAPATSEATTTTMDVFPTVLDLTATIVPAGRDLDGTSLRLLLAGEKDSLPARRLFWMYKGGAAAREGNWKLTEIDGVTSLFDLGSDLGETTDDASRHPDIVTRLSAALQRWKAETLPTSPGELRRPAAGQPQAADR